MNLLRKVAYIFDRTNDSLVIVAGIILIFLMLSVVNEIVTRYFLGHSQFWVLEVTSYMLPFITFLVATWVLKREAHVKVEIVLSRLNPRTQALVTTITSVISAIICLAIAWYGIRVTWNCFQDGVRMATELGPPKWVLLWIIPVGSILLVVQFLRRAYTHLERFRALPHKEQGGIDGA